MRLFTYNIYLSKPKVYAGHRIQLKMLVLFLTRTCLRSSVRRKQKGYSDVFLVPSFMCTYHIKDTSTCEFVVVVVLVGTIHRRVSCTPHNSQCSRWLKVLASRKVVGRQDLRLWLQNRFCVVLQALKEHIARGRIFGEVGENFVTI